MAEHPILFSAPMIRALLEGRKTVTRRLSKRWLKVKAGDRLWVREAFAQTESDGGPVVAYRAGGYLINGADGDKRLGTWREFVFQGEAGQVYPPETWKPSIHMPRWASRITLEAVEDAKTEPLHWLTEKEAQREGVELISPEAPWITGGSFERYVQAFNNLWGKLHTKPGERWQDNPDVVRIAFEVLR